MSKNNEQCNVGLDERCRDLDTLRDRTGESLSQLVKNSRRNGGVR